MNINMNEIENLRNEMSELKKRIMNDFTKVIMINEIEELSNEYKSIKIEYDQDIYDFKIKVITVDMIVNDTGLKENFEGLEKTYRDCLNKIYNKQACEIVSLDKAKEIGKKIGYGFIGTTEECWKYCDDNKLTSVNGCPVNAFMLIDSTKIKGKKFYTNENYEPWDCVR